MSVDDIRFSEKKVDEGWKEQAGRDAQGVSGKSPDQKESVSSGDDPQFSNFLSSLAIQALVHLGEIENPSTKKKSPDFDAAKEIIELLLMFKKKTAGNLTTEEARFFDTLLADLQVKFARLVGD